MSQLLRVFPFIAKMIAIRRALLAGALLAGSLTACTTVTIYSRDGVETHIYPGVVLVNARPDSGPQFVQTEGYGVIASSHDFALGWLRQGVAEFPDPNQCALMIVPNNLEEWLAYQEIRNDKINFVNPRKQ